MEFIVYDLEWNQPERPDKMIKDPIVLRGEIIQIGAVKLDKDLTRLDTFKILVHPVYYRKNEQADFKNDWVMGRMESPSSLSAYSTRDGTSGKTVRVMIPSASNARRLSVRTLWLIPGMERSI